MKEKIEWLQHQLNQLPVTFRITGVEKFDQNGIHNESIVLEYENEEFVLVEGGKNVQLGWDVEQCSLGINVLNEFKRDHEEGIDYYQSQYKEIKADYEERIEATESDAEKANLRLEMEEDLQYSKAEGELTWEEYRDRLVAHIKENTSPLRTVDISPMIVERDSQYIEADLSYTEFRRLRGEIAPPPFTLPTEDEWEYLCGAGTRTFFRWGDSLDIAAMYSDKENPFYHYNMNGLRIAYNPYRFELIANETYVKGGDGGCSMCGGDGAAYVAPCFSSFYRQKLHAYEDELSKSFYTYRRIIRLPY